MSVLYLLIPIAMIFLIVAIGLFFWAVKNNQFEDLERQGMSILMDDDSKPAQNITSKDSESSD